MNNKVKIMAILLLITLAVCFIGCSQMPADEELPKLTDGTKAIVVIPGIMGSSVYNEDTGEQLWDPFVTDAKSEYYMDFQPAIQDEISKNLFGLLKIINDIYAQTEGNIFDQLSSDEDGIMKYSSVVGYNPDFSLSSEDSDISERRQFGALYMYEPIVEELRERYGNDYEVVLFNYNFLQDNRISAEQFEEFVNERNYTEMIVVAHSMGGHIASQYFTKKENRARVDKYISIAVPYYGSMIALDLIEDPYCYEFLLEEVKEQVCKMGLGDMLKEILDNLPTLYENVVVKLLRTTSSIYQLLPSQESVDLDSSIFSIDGSPLSDNLFEFYKSRSFGLKSDGGIRACLDELEEYYASFYVNKKGALVYSADLVDGYYIAGSGYSTSYSIEYNDDGYIVNTTTAGDSTVTVQSATRGKKVDGERVVLVNQMHAMGNTFDGECRDVVFRIIDNAING